MSVQDTDNAKVLKRGRGRPKKIVSLPEERRRTVVPVLPHPGDNMIILPSKVMNSHSNSKQQNLLKKANVTENLKTTKNRKVYIKNKVNHKAEEKKRKDRLNMWIDKLAKLLFRNEVGKQSKRTILETAYTFIQRKQKTSAAICEEDRLIARIKHLEASIILLLGILKKYNIEPPVGFKDPLSVVTPPVTSHDELQMTQKLNKVNNVSNEADSGGIPLHINLILPPLSLNSQSHTSSIITLTATASMKDSCVSTVQVSSVQLQPSTSTSSKTLSVNSVSTSFPSPTVTNIEHSEVDFQKNVQHSSKKADFKSIDVNTLTKSAIKSTINKTKISNENSSLKLPKVNDLNTCITDLSNPRKHTNHMVKELPKSSTQGFGIDNILVSSPTESNITSSSSSSSLSSSSKMSTSDIASYSKPSVSSVQPQPNRSRLPSSGHTVAALLEPASSNVKSTYNKNDTQTKDLVSKTETPSQSKHVVTASNLMIKTSEQSAHNTTSSSIPSTNALQRNTVTTTANSVSRNSKRWSKFVENTHNSESMFLSSFHLSSPTPNKSSSKRKQKKKKINICNDKNNKPVPIKSPLIKSTEKVPTKLADSEEIVTSSKMIARSTTTTNITTNSVATIADMLVAQTYANHLTTCTTSYVSSLAITNTTSSRLPSSIASSSLPLSSHTSQKLSNPMIRTMKDRTVRNKWLPTQAVTIIEETQHHSKPTHNLPININKPDIPSTSNHSPAIDICTNTLTECAVEQCASPVISYPNTGKRKRKLTYNSSNQQQTNNNSNLTKKHATLSRQHFVHTTFDGTTNVGGNTSNSVGTSQNFLAESLCRSSSNHPNHRTKKSRTERKEKEPAVSINKHQTNDKSAHNQNAKYSATVPQGYSQQRQQQPPPDLSAVNTLPTILNIFAPAPSTQLSQQQTFQSAFSNFSAENLVGNECNLGVIDTNNLNDQTFSDNMLIAANSPLFTNFSADSLIAGNDPPVPFAINNLINPSNNTWNQSWLPADVNEAIFQNMGGSQATRPNRQQQLLPSSTDSSPIKSIMSILNSAPNNTSNFHLENLSSEHVHAMSNPFPSNNPQSRVFTRDTRMNLNNSGGESTSDFMMNPSAMWFTKNTNNSLKNLSNSNMSIPPWHTFNTMQNNQQMTRPPFIKDGNSSSNNIPVTASLQNTMPNQKLPGKTRDNTAGPMFGNISLVNSMSTT